MRLSLSTKIILSMASMVVLTAVTCCVIFLIIVNNRTRDLENRLEEIRAQAPVAPTPPSAQEIITKLKTVLNNGQSAEAQLTELRQSVRPVNIQPGLDFDKVRQAIADSGWPISPYDPITIRRPEPGQDPRNTTIGVNPTVLDSLLTNPIYSSVLISSLISVVFAVGLGFLISRTVIRPLRMLEKASERIADGNYNLQLKPEGRDDLGRLARSFNKMSRALRLTEQKRKDLVADVSHELRTPLSSIQGYTEVLRDGLITEDERRNGIYEHILKEVRHLTEMVNSMRQWVNNEQELASMSMESFGVIGPAQSILARFEPTAQAQDIALKLEIANPEPQVLANSEALAHALSNLIDNALRYTPAGGAITIKVDAPDHEKRIWWHVQDTGCGIAEEHLPFIFERFYRVDKSRDRDTGGSGLGLAIVRDSIQAMGGDVTISSEPEVGTTISFSLPQAAKTTSSLSRHKQLAEVS